MQLTRYMCFSGYLCWIFEVRSASEGDIYFIFPLFFVSCRCDWKGLCWNVVVDRQLFLQNIDALQKFYSLQKEELVF